MEWHITYEVKVWFGLVSAPHGTCIGRGGTRVWSAQQSRPSAVVFTSVLWPTHRVALLEFSFFHPPQSPLFSSIKIIITLFNQSKHPGKG